MKHDRSENPVFRYARGEGRDDQRGVTRRQVVQQLVAGVGGGAAFASIGRAGSRRDEEEGSPAVTPAQAETGSVGPVQWSPQFFDAHQNETLLALGERIVPGSSRAQANRMIDLLLSVESEAVQRKFLQSLSAFDAEAIKRNRQPFVGLTEEQQNRILVAASEGAAGQRPKEWYESDSDASNPAAEDVPMTLRSHFDNIKEWVVRCYYNSEAGLKDLGWTGRVMWDTFPACEHPGGHK
jgi:hypothetical protein